MNHSEGKMLARRRSVVARTAVLVMIASLAFLLVAPATRASQTYRVSAAKGKKSNALAHVRYIHKGLTVTAPHKKPGKGKKNQSLYSKYFLGTGRGQTASVGFKDGTVLHMNQRTSAVLTSPSITKVSQGEVDEVLAPGTNHTVQTATAVASAIGTEFDLHVGKHGVTKLTVVEGAVLLKARKGAQETEIVQTGQAATVSNNGTVTTPQPTNAAQTTSWVNPIPPPPEPLGENIALAANGGAIDKVSSQRAAAAARQTSSSSSNPAFSADNLIDGDPSTSWQSADGLTTNQFVTVKFAYDGTYDVTKIVLDCSATNGEPAADDLNNFQIWVSTGNDNQQSFTKVLDGVCQEKTGLQTFPLPTTTRARYVELVALDNHGGTDGIAVNELEVVSPDMVTFTHGNETPVPTNTPTDTPTVTNTPVPPTATPQPTNTPTNTPVPTPTNTPAPPTPTNTPVPTPTNTPVPPTPTFTPVPPQPSPTVCNVPGCFVR